MFFRQHLESVVDQVLEWIRSLLFKQEMELRGLRESMAVSEVRAKVGARPWGCAALAVPLSAGWTIQEVPSDCYHPPCPASAVCSAARPAFRVVAEAESSRALLSSVFFSFFLS